MCFLACLSCRPGEGNPTVTHASNPHTLPPAPADFVKEPPNSPTSPQYAALVAAATEAARRHHDHHGHHLVIMCAADFDYRELAENWFKAASRLGLTNALVYALDVPAYEYLKARGVNAVDGSANLDAWNRTRITRHSHFPATCFEEARAA